MCTQAINFLSDFLPTRKNLGYVQLDETYIGLALVDIA
jgi:hypothetical protein